MYAFTILIGIFFSVRIKEANTRHALRDAKGYKKRAKILHLIVLNSVTFLRFTLFYNPLMALSFVATYWIIGLYHAYFD